MLCTHIYTHLLVCTCVKGIVKYLIASHRGRRVFNTSLLSSTELPSTLMRSASVLPVSYQVLPEESILCQCFVGSESEAMLPQVAVHIVLTHIGFPENTTTLGSSCHFGSDQKACLKSATMAPPLCRYLHNVRRSRLGGLAVYKAQKVNFAPLVVFLFGVFSPPLGALAPAFILTFRRSLCALRSLALCSSRAASAPV